MVDKMTPIIIKLRTTTPASRADFTFSFLDIKDIFAPFLVPLIDKGRYGAVIKHGLNGIGNRLRKVGFFLSSYRIILVRNTKAFQKAATVIDVGIDKAPTKTAASMVPSSSATDSSS